MDTLHHIEFLRRYELDREHPEYGGRWVYERPILWRHQAEYEDDLHRLEQEVKRREEMTQMTWIAQKEPRLGPQPWTEAQQKEAALQLDELIETAKRKFQEDKSVPNM